MALLVERCLVLRAVVLALVGATASSGRADAVRSAQQARPIEVRPARNAPLLGPLDYQVGSSIVWLSDTSLAIADGSEHQVVVFGTSGREIARLGRSGRGPGEFAIVGPLLASERGELVAADMALSRVSYFDARFRFVRSVQLSGMPTSLLSWRGSRIAAVWSPANPMGEGPTVGDVDLAAGTASGRYVVFRADSALGATISVGGFAIRPPFVVAAAARDGAYLFARADQYRVVGIDSAGVVRRTFGRPELPPVYRTEPEMQAEEERLQRASQRAGVTPPPGTEDVMRDAMREMLRRPKPFLSSALAVDQLGRLWVGANRGAGDSSEVDVFSPRGEFLQTVVFARRVQALSFRLPRVAVLAQHRGGPYDEQSEVSVYVVSGGEARGGRSP